MKFNAMFQPINIGPMTVKNRFVVPPMGNNFANTDGSFRLWSHHKDMVCEDRPLRLYVLLLLRL